MTSRVGVVVRSRGNRAQLDRAIGSARDQTFQDWTAAVVGDGSGAAPTASADERIFAVDAPVPGPAAAANAALAALAERGVEHVVLLDDDGSWAPEFLARSVAHLDATPGDLAVATRAQVIYEDVDADGIHERGREVLAAGRSEASLIATTEGNYVPASSLLVRRTALEQVGALDVELDTLAEWDLLLRLLATGPVGFLDGEPLAAWHTSVEEPGGPLPELDVRDRYLRHDLAAGGAPGALPTGLGTQLALAHQLRALGAEATAARTDLAAAVDRWGHAHQDQLELTASDLRLEVGRLRGDMLVLRETVSDIEGHLARLSDQLDRSLKRTNRNINETLRALGNSANHAAAQPAPEPASGRVRRALGQVSSRVRSRGSRE